MSGFQLSTQSAQRIVAEIGGIVGQNINMMDAQGYIIASTDPARIGFLHEGARQIIEERLPELYIRAEEATATARTGLNLPITHRGDIVGVIGITGEYGQVIGYGQVVKKMTEILSRTTNALTCACAAGFWRTGCLLAALCRGRRLRNAALLSASISPSHGASW